MNALNVIFPYKFEGMWVFDDEHVVLRQEPFVSGADTMIDRIVADLSDADKGFHLIFAATPFPGYAAKLIWNREEYGGNWYDWEGAEMEGWLCPALFKYFKTAPHKIYVKVEAKSR